MKKGIICITGFLLLIVMVGVGGACTVQRTDLQANNAFTDTDDGHWGHHGSAWAFSKFSERLFETEKTAEAEDISPRRQWRHHHRHHQFGLFNRLDASTAEWLVGWLIDKYDLSNLYAISDSESSGAASHAPVPPSVLLLASGLVGLVGYRRTINKST